jgi:hypothetical protein
MTTTTRFAAACLAAAFAACSDGGSSSGGGTPEAPTLTLSRVTLAFPATAAGAALPAAETVAVTNSGGGTLVAPALTVSYGAAGTGWLDATAAAGGAGYVVTLRPKTTALAPATYTASVQVACAGASGSPKSVAISWQISAPPGAVIVATPPALSFTAQQGGPAPAPQTITVTNGGPGALDPLTVADDQAWLTASASGLAVTVEVAVGTVAAGQYSGSVTITSANAGNSPLSVPVSLAIGQPTPIDTSTLVSAVTTLYGASVDRLQECFHWAPGLVALLKTEYAALATVLRDVQTAGRLTYSRTQADQCAAALTAATCAQLDGWIGGLPDTCAALVVPTVANGNACYSSIECANGYCTSDLMAACPGACTGFVASGGACTDYLVCASGACDGVVCVPDVPGGQGQPCGGGSVGCQAGLYCTVGSTCAQRLAAGATCAWHEQCAAGLGCASDGTCRAWAGTGADCTTATCGEGFYCSLAGGSTCVEWPTQGRSCAEFPMCADGSYCSGGTCVAGTVPIGNACDATSLFCVPGAFCQMSGAGTGTCTALPAPDACY